MLCTHFIVHSTAQNYIDLGSYTGDTSSKRWGIRDGRSRRQEKRGIQRTERRVSVQP
jgi:hypothetical protein